MNGKLHKGCTGLAGVPIGAALIVGKAERAPHTAPHSRPVRATTTPTRPRSSGARVSPKCAWAATRDPEGAAARTGAGGERLARSGDVTDWGIIIGAGGLVLAVAAELRARRAEKRAAQAVDLERAAEQRARRAEERAERSEARDIELGERARRRDEPQLRLDAFADSGRGGPGDLPMFLAVIRNVGEATATDVSAAPAASGCWRSSQGCRAPLDCEHGDGSIRICGAAGRDRWQSEAAGRRPRLGRGRADQSVL